MGERSSYGKTVQDATFMRMKNDETLPAYNLQIGTENGFVTGVSVHQSANDGKVFIELMEKRKALGIGQPQNAIADAGCGYRSNYDYLDSRGIEGCIKYPGYRAEDKNLTKTLYKHYKLTMNDAGEIHCPSGYKMRKEDELLHFNSSIYRCDFCGICSNRLDRIGKGKDYKRLEVNRHYRYQQKRAKKRLQTNTGQRLYSRRSNEVESVFGDMKHNRKFTHFNLRGLEKVHAETYLYMMAYNLRKMGVTGTFRIVSSLGFSLYSSVAFFMACIGRISASGRFIGPMLKIERISRNIQLNHSFFGC